MAEHSNANNTAMLKVASRVKLFAGMERSLLVTLLAAADKTSVAANELFFNEGDTGESFYVLFIGQVVIERLSGGTWIELARLHPGDSFGEMTLIEEKIRSARVRAVSDCVALYFPMSRLRAHHEVLSGLFLNIAKILVGRLKVSNAMVTDLSTRLAHYEKETPKVAAPTPVSEEKNPVPVGAPVLEPAVVKEDLHPTDAIDPVKIAEMPFGSEPAAGEKGAPEAQQASTGEPTPKAREWWLETMVSG